MEEKQHMIVVVLENHLSLNYKQICEKDLMCYSNHNKFRNFEEAGNYCKQIGGHLATVNTETQLNAAVKAGEIVFLRHSHYTSPDFKTKDRGENISDERRSIDNNHLFSDNDVQQGVHKRNAWLGYRVTQYEGDDVTLQTYDKNNNQKDVTYTISKNGYDKSSENKTAGFITYNNNKIPEPVLHWDFNNSLDGKIKGYDKDEMRLKGSYNNNESNDNFIYNSIGAVEADTNKFVTVDNKKSFNFENNKEFIHFNLLNQNLDTEINNLRFKKIRLTKTHHDGKRNQSSLV